MRYALPSHVLTRGQGRRVLGGSFAATLVLLVALLAGFGWLDLLRAFGGLSAGPHVADALPLRKLAGDSAQPLTRVVIAWASVGLGAGVALVRVPRLKRLSVLALGALLLLSLASEVAYAVEESLNLGTTLSTRRPGPGVAIEAGVFALAAAALPVRRRRARDEGERRRSR